MKVYLVYSGVYEDRDVEGVYATLEAAQAAHVHEAGWEGKHGGWGCTWEVRHHRAKMPVSIALETRTLYPVDGVVTLPSGAKITVPEGQVVSVPVFPDGSAYDFPGQRDWIETCDVEIVERTVIE